MTPISLAEMVLDWKQVRNTYVDSSTLHPCHGETLLASNRELQAVPDSDMVFGGRRGGFELNRKASNGTVVAGVKVIPGA